MIQMSGDSEENWRLKVNCEVCGRMRRGIVMRREMISDKGSELLVSSGGRAFIITYIGCKGTEIFTLCCLMGWGN